MRFFEFNEFDYYALIGAETEDEAINFYQEAVADIENDDDKPDEITEEQVREKIINDTKEKINEIITLLKDFDENIKSTIPFLILIDGALN